MWEQPCRIGALPVEGVRPTQLGGQLLLLLLGLSG